jgi:hypothetical protein
METLCFTPNSFSALPWQSARVAPQAATNRHMRVVANLIQIKSERPDKYHRRTQCVP